MAACRERAISLSCSRRGAAAQDFGEPELADGTLHVGNLALAWSRRLDPLRWLAADTADHVGVSQGLGRPQAGLHAQSRGQRLDHARVQRRRPAGGLEGRCPLPSWVAGRSIDRVRELVKEYERSEGMMAVCWRCLWDQSRSLGW